MSEKDTKKLVSELRPGFIALKDINGVDFENCTIIRGPDFRNPKFKLRKHVLRSLSTAQTPKDKPPVEIYTDKGGVVECLDGDHRVVDALIKCEGDPEHPVWSRIRATPFYGTREAAVLRAKTADFEASRSTLTEAEEVRAIKDLLDTGYSTEEIIEKVGRTSKRQVNRIEAIIAASPEVLEAVMSGNATIFEGATVATRVPLEEQGEAIEKIKEAKGEKADEEEEADETEEERPARPKRASRALEQSGITKERTKTLKLSEIYALYWPHYESHMAMLEGTEHKDAFVLGFGGALLRVLLMPPDDKERQESDGDAWTVTEIRDRMDPLYEAYRELQRHPPKKRPRKKG